MLDAVDRLGLDRVDAGAGHTVAESADLALAAVDTQVAVGRSPGGG